MQNFLDLAAGKGYNNSAYSEKTGEFRDSSEVKAINRQKFLAELTQLLSFMYEDDRRYALNMYERMFDIAEGSEQWLIQNLMSPTRQAVIIARSYDAKERKLSVSTEWKDETLVDENGETPQFVLAINKIFDDLFPDEEEEADQEPDDDLHSSQRPDSKVESKPKKPKMPKAAVLLNRTQEFHAVLKTEGEEAPIPDDDREDAWTESDTAEIEADDEEDLVAELTKVKIEYIDRAEFDPEETVPEVGADAALEAEAGTLRKDDSAVAESAATSAQKNVDIEVAAPETETETKPKASAQPQNRDKKRRSIEDLLGLRKDRNRENAQDPTESKQDGPSEAEEREEPKQETEPADHSAEEKKTTAAEQLRDDDGVADAGRDMKTDSDQLPQGQIARSIKPEPDAGDPVSVGGDKEKRDTEKSHAVEEQDAAQKPDQLLYEIPDEEAPVISKPVPAKSTEETAPAEREWNIPILVLFLVVAIPLTLAVVAILLVPLALFFSLSIGLIALGTVLVVSAFSGFAVLADIMLLLGSAAISLALGLLFLWLSFWLVGDVMVGLVRRVRELAETCCYKEVAKT